MYPLSQKLPGLGLAWTAQASLARLEFFTDGIFVITMCLVLVEMRPLMSADVLHDRAAVSLLCEEQGMRYESAMLATGHDTAGMHAHDDHGGGDHGGGDHGGSVDGHGHHRRQLLQLLDTHAGAGVAHHGRRQLLRMLQAGSSPANVTAESQQHMLRELDCEVQWCRYNDSAISGSKVLSSLCVPNCEVDASCGTGEQCTKREYVHLGHLKEITDQDTCEAQGGSWGGLMLHSFLKHSNWPKAQTHLAASFVMMSLWFVHYQVFLTPHHAGHGHDDGADPHDGGGGGGGGGGEGVHGGQTGIELQERDAGIREQNAAAQAGARTPGEVAPVKAAADNRSTDTGMYSAPTSSLLRPQRIKEKLGPNETDSQVLTAANMVRTAAATAAPRFHGLSLL
eukprot:SAG22_NODE_300_length_12752_cov_3.102426_7_plen_395_part_00